jgi:hypothetical protein
MWKQSAYRIISLLLLYFCTPVLRGQEIETFTYPANPHKVNFLQTQQTIPEGYILENTKYWVWSGPIDLKEKNGIYVYDGPPGSKSEILQSLSFRHDETGTIDIQLRKFIIIFQDDQPPPDTPDVPPDTPPVKPDQVSKAAYIYEGKETSLPHPLRAALMEIKTNHGIHIAALDKDSVTGENRTPTQYREILTVAIRKGIPCLVIEYSNGSHLVVSNPQTKEDIKKALGL